MFSERFEPWRYGPVIGSLYDVFKNNKANAIKQFGESIDGKIWIVDIKPGSVFKSVLDDVWEKYKNVDGIRLSEMTHQKDTAWRKALLGGKTFLSDGDIKEEKPFVVH